MDCNETRYGKARLGQPIYEEIPIYGKRQKGSRARFVKSQALRDSAWPCEICGHRIIGIKSAAWAGQKEKREKRFAALSASPKIKYALPSGNYVFALGGPGYLS